MIEIKTVTSFISTPGGKYRVTDSIIAPAGEFSFKGDTNMTMDELIASEGGFENVLNILGWQGGTIQQVKNEIRKRMSGGGIYENIEGQWVKLEITE
jgi:hypothetical protein